jgi:uncharacterized membrane protein
MIWILAFVGALVAAFLASEGEALFGFLAGFAVIAALGLLHRQSQRIDSLARELAVQKARLSTLLPGTAPPKAQAPDASVVVAPAPAPAPTKPAAAASAAAEPPPLPEPTPAAAPPAADALGARTRRPAPAHVDAADALDGITARLRTFFFEGNVPVKLGLVVSLFGVAALIRYAASVGLLDVPVSVRYALIALAAIAMLAYGLRQTPLRPAFGLSLQGGAIGILLLTVFGSYRVPGLLPAVPAFALVLGLVAGAAVLAIRQNAVWLAAIGFLGGYLAPLLLSTGSGNHVALFTWYALLNGAVFGMAWVRPWRALNLMGFVSTFGVGAIWGAQYFRPELFATTEPFLVLFFLMYVSIPVLYALKGREPGKVDATLLFGTPLIAFPMQVALLDGERLPLAFSALAVGAVYLLLALWSRREEKLRVLGQSAAALGLAFATLAVPLALSARWTSAAWALQGVALLWLGQAQDRRWPQVAGIALQVLAGVAYLVSADLHEDSTAIFNAHTLNLLLLTFSAGFCAWLLDRRDGGRRSAGGALMTVIASAWWAWAGAREIAFNLAGSGLTHGAGWIGFVALSSGIAALLLWRLDWRKPAWWPAVALPSALLGVGLAALEDQDWLVQGQGMLLPLLALAMVLVLPTLRRTPNRLAFAHIGGLAALCLAIGLGIREGLSDLNEGMLGEGWRWIVPWVPLALLATLLARRPQWAAWPVGDAIEGYRRVALGLAALVLGGLWAVTLTLGASATPLPWLPLLNPVELFQVAGLVAAALWVRGLKAESGLRTFAQVALLLGGFAVASMATLRACLHLFDDGGGAFAWSSGVDWSRVAGTLEAQAALSIVWALGGVLCWVLGSRRGSRTLWTFGASLLGLVLLKLLLVDRSNLGDLLGIVSFLAVGGLLVLVGRIAPRPPSRTTEPA